METTLLLLAKGLMSLAASLAVLRLLSGPLVRVLNRVCPDEQAAAFWLTYTKVMLTIAPLLLVLLIDMATTFANPVEGLRVTLMASLTGLLVGLHSIGRRLGRFVVIPRQPGGLS